MAARRHLAEWLTLLVGLGGTIWLWRTSQPPGYAIGLLAAVAFVMTFSRPTTVQKMLVVALAATLFYLETKAIKNDRKAQEASSVENLKAILGDNRTKTKTILDDNRDKTKVILDDNQQRYQTTEQNFANVLGTDQAIKGVADRALKAITGGSSFPMMFPISVEICSGVSLERRCAAAG